MKAASSDGLTEESVHGFSALSVLSCSIDCLCRAECIATGNRIFNRRKQRARRITVPDILGQLAKIRQKFQAVNHRHVRSDSSTKVGLPICQFCQPLRFELLGAAGDKPHRYPHFLSPRSPERGLFGRANNFVGRIMQHPPSGDGGYKENAAF